MLAGRLGAEGTDDAEVGLASDFFEEPSFLEVFGEVLSLDAVAFFEVLALVIFFYF
jgi:hypothetical protein